MTGRVYMVLNAENKKPVDNSAFYDKEVAIKSLKFSYHGFEKNGPVSLDSRGGDLYLMTWHEDDGTLRAAYFLIQRIDVYDEVVL